MERLIADLQRRVDMHKSTGHLNVPIPIEYVMQLIKCNAGEKMPTKATRVKIIPGKDGARPKVATTQSRRKSVSAKIAARNSRKARAVSPAKARARATSAAPVAKLVSRPTHRDPKTGKTWSGRGRRPLWLKEAHRV